MTTAVVPSSRIVYPDTDGQPMAENTLQFQWIVTIKEGLEHVFASAPNVFVAGDLFWYPVEGHPEIRIAPDAMVAIGPPKGHRLSYLQWEEGNVPPQVVVEVLSPGNRLGEMTRKFEFYRRYGVEEYYMYDPDPQRLDLVGYVRQGDALVEVPSMNGHVSPRLGVRFEMGDDGLRLYGPDGQQFLTFDEWIKRAEAERQRAEGELRRAEQAARQVEQERQRADEAERAAREARAETERLRQQLESMRQKPGSPPPGELT